MLTLSKEQRLNDNQEVIRFYSFFLESLDQEERKKHDLISRFKTLGSSPELASGIGFIELLIEQQPETLALATNRFSHEGLFLNLTKLMLRDPLEMQIKSLCDLSQLLIEKSKLLFNRVYYSELGRSTTYPVLHSTTLSELSGQVGEILDVVSGFYQDSFIFHGSNFAKVDQRVIESDERIATALEFKEISYSKYDFFEEFISSIHQKTQVFLSKMKRYLEESVPSKNHGHLAEVSSMIDQIELLMTQFNAISFPKVSYYLGYENSRIQFLGILFDIAASTEKLEKATREFLKIFIKSDLPNWPNSVVRRLQYELMIRGETEQDARSICKALVDYCNHYRIAPASIIEQEWKNIHPKLQESDLVLFKDMYQESQPKFDSTCKILERNSNIKRMEKVSGLVRTTKNLLASSSITPMLLLFFIGGCGVKTKPVSDILDKRPQIPFKIEEMQKEKSEFQDTKTKLEGQQDDQDRN